jgi:hypothetical protein
MRERKGNLHPIITLSRKIRLLGFAQRHQYHRVSLWLSSSPFRINKFLHENELRQSSSSDLFFFKSYFILFFLFFWFFCFFYILFILIFVIFLLFFVLFVWCILGRYHLFTHQWQYKYMSSLLSTLYFIIIVLCIYHHLYIY